MLPILDITIKSVLNRKFSTSFFNGALVSRKGDFFCIYFEGLSGKVYFNESGILSIQCYYRFKNIYHGFIYQTLFKEHYNQLGFGYINSAEEFVNLEFTINGDRWISSSFLLTNYLIKNEGIEIDVPISKIMYTGYQELNTGVYRAYIPISFDLFIPINKVEYFNNGGFSWNECSFCINELNISIKRQKNFYALTLKTHKKEDINKLVELFKEAFNIYQGRIVPYHLETQILNDTIFKVINSQTEIINEPLSVFRTLNDNTGLNDFKKFMKSYISFHQEPRSEMYEWWRKINDVSKNIFEVRALVYSVSIEGIINKYYNNLVTKNESFLTILKQDKALLKSYKNSFNDSTYQRLSNSLAYFQNETATSRLNYLCTQGLLDEQLIKSWKRLRNPLAHGDFTTTTNQPYEKMEDYQKDLLSCLELFYRLVFLKIGYMSNFKKISDKNLSLDSYKSFYYPRKVTSYIYHSNFDQ